MILKHPYEGGRNIGDFSHTFDNEGNPWQFVVKDGLLWAQKHEITPSGQWIAIEGTRKEAENLILKLGPNYSKSKVWRDKWREIRGRKIQETVKKWETVNVSK